VLRKTLNLGILAHVDAGKTTLTERLLFAAGVIGELGSVDAGNTHTDSLALEQQRGITIKSAVVSFPLSGITVNLIDTPGHPDFIAEVERVLSVLDGAVLVISAVEGVQSQTPLLMRALQRLQVPTLFFVNKIDRLGADPERFLEVVSERLTPAVVAMGSAQGLGTPAADFVAYGPGDATFVGSLAELDDRLLAAYVNEESSMPYARLRNELVSRSRRGLVHPAFFGSAITGAGIEALTAGIAELLPARAGEAGRPLSGTVFKIERGSAGEKVAYVRLRSGSIHVRDRLRIRAGEATVTQINVFAEGKTVRRSAVSAGEIAKLWGLGDVRIGDPVGTADQEERHHFPAPTLESVVVPLDPARGHAVRVALTQLAEQDPLINVRQDSQSDEICVSLYGEVQKEVIAATLEADYGVAVAFRRTTTVHVERVVGTGEALEILRARTKTNVTGKSSPTSSNPYHATLGLRIQPALVGSGIALRLDVDVRLVPIYLYKTVSGFSELMTQYVREALQAGLFGSQVPDCTVTVTDCGYQAPGTRAADFRNLAALVVVRALQEAGTVVCEPIVRVTVEVPPQSVGPLLPMLSRFGSVLKPPSIHGSVATIEAAIPAARAHDLQQQLPHLTGGEGLVETKFERYEPVLGAQPRR
jgi:ribosomal protection tetracycline resistance protein